MILNKVFDKTLNIIVLGAIGTGKSTLVNAVLGEELALTGIGMPVTNEIKEYKKDDICIWDTVGLELLDSEKNEKIIQFIKDKIVEKSRQSDTDVIHAIWYCINGGFKRYQQSELDFIKKLYKDNKVPFFIILTQCFNENDSNEVEKEIIRINKENRLDDIEIIQVVAKDWTVKFNGQTITVKQRGLTELVDRTYEKVFTKQLDIIVMGKTGVGKSTFIKSILKEGLTSEDLAFKELPHTGIGMPITKENKIYSKKIRLNNENFYLKLYDTVGLEIDNNITNKTLIEIKNHIEESKKNIENSNMHVVFFCVNNESNRFESFEIDLIRKLSIEYEIPFVIVITQCYDDEKGELEKKVENELPEVLIKRVLAKDYKFNGFTIYAYGVFELLSSVIDNYRNLKVKILENKIKLLDEKYQKRIEKIKFDCEKVISDYSKGAIATGIVPLIGSVGATNILIYQMISDINKVVGFKLDKDCIINELIPLFLASDIVGCFMSVPFFSILVSYATCNFIGEEYLKILMKIIESSNDSELKDTEKLKKRIREELKPLKKLTFPAPFVDKKSTGAVFIFDCQIS